ncbi:MAG: DNA internalization-related competence protein ComEC/Rec2 [Gammaproteobacteria bacterium]|nr:DNA internalization-related competence protein ComEC/Rec2 [Gammaproteobacteria bacterium]
MDYKAGMFVYALAYLLGVVFLQQLGTLPELSSLLALLLCACLFFILSRFAIKHKKRVFKKEITLINYAILMFLLGLIGSFLYADQQLSHRLDESFTGKTLLVTGFVSNIPVTDGFVQRFEFILEDYRVLASNSKSRAKMKAPLKFPQKVRLSWYYGEQVNAAEKWQFEVRLKPPHGFMNPGGFDYEAWLFQHGIPATGYVRKSALNQRKQDSSRPTFIGSINSIRQSLSQQIDVIASNQLDSHNMGKAGQSADGTGSYALVKALAVGFKSSISAKQWQVLINTGTSHLMAISGLHIGLASLFTFVLIRRTVPAFIIKRIPAQHIAITGGMVVALLYALIAGLSVSTQRAIIMLFVLSIMMLIRRNHRPVDALGFALLLVLLIDPLAVLSVGFWFSFSAVAVIFISLDSSSLATVQPQNVLNTSVWTKVISTIKQWIRLQLIISLFLLPLSLFMFQQVSLISPVANFLLIPYVSFLVVPVVLLALVCNLIFPAIAEMLFILSATLLDIIWPVLFYLSALPNALLIQGDVGVLKLLIATSAMLLIFFGKRLARFISRKIFNKQCFYRVYGLLFFIALLMFMPIFIIARPQLKTGEYRVTVLDVGQGSAAVLQTQSRVLVFDTGAKFSDRLDAGSSVVIPYLRSLGVRSLDYLIISHGDTDHIGGAQAILDEYPATDVIGQDIENLQTKNKVSCFEGFKWQWDGVDFEFLSPARGDISLLPGGKRNNHSCVLQVASKSGVVLFTGDIEKRVERHLLNNYDKQLAADILIVPHHGSKTSSSSAFINTINPKISLFSLGYKNRYKFPNNEVWQRYELLNSDLIQTDKTGAITINLTETDGIVVTKYREQAGKYWHHEF